MDAQACLKANLTILEDIYFIDNKIAPKIYKAMNTYAHDAIIDYEKWRGNEMRDGGLSIKDFNDLVPEQLFKMYLEWNKAGRWTKNDK